MFGMWDIRDVGCLRCGMFGMWDVRDVGCSGCGMFGMWDVRDVGCSGCGMWDVGCLQGCGMLIYKMPLGYSFNHRVGGATYKSWYYCHDFGKNGTYLLNMFLSSFHIVDSSDSQNEVNNVTENNHVDRNNDFNENCKSLSYSIDTPYFH